MLRRLAAELVDQADYVLTLVRLTSAIGSLGRHPKPRPIALFGKKASGYAGRFRMSILTIHAHGRGGGIRNRHLARRQFADPTARHRRRTRSCPLSRS
jgi:hypothetical protein